MAKIVGIDLGTTNSVVAVVQNGTSTVIPTAEGDNICPSVVGFSKTGEILVGQVAKRQAVVNPENTVYSIKRFMGRRYDEVAEERKIVPYKVVVPGPEGDARVEIPQTGKTYTPQEISAMILQKLKRDAEAYLGEPVNQAVITVLLATLEIQVIIPRYKLFHNIKRDESRGKGSQAHHPKIYAASEACSSAQSKLANFS